MSGKAAAEQEELTIQRILIGLDASYHSFAALEAAAELASSLGAELRGLFVEDINLLRLAELSVAQELQFPFGAQARLNPKRMRRQLRAQAQQAREALVSVCRRRQIEWSFETVRGDVSAKVLEEAEQADLLCVGRASRPVIRQSSVGSTALAAVTRAPYSVLLVSRETRISAPVVVLYEGSAESSRALQIGSQLAEDTGGLLSILVHPSVSESSREIQDRIASALEAQGFMVRYRELFGSGLISTISAVQAEAPGTVVLGRSFLPSDSVPEFLEEIDCPVLLAH